MYKKNIAGSDKITYKAFLEPLNENYAEAAEFMQKLFNIDKNIKIRVMNKSNLIMPVIFSLCGIPALVFGISNSNILSIILGLSPLLFNCPRFLNHSSNFYSSRPKYIHIGKNASGTAAIVGYTVVALSDAGILPKTDLWLPRVALNTFGFSKLQEKGSCLKNLQYTEGSSYIYFLEGCDYYKMTRETEKSAFIDNTRGFPTEKYPDPEQYGTFISGIVISILEDTHSIESVKLFLQKLIDRTPLEDALREVIGR